MDFTLSTYKSLIIILQKKNYHFLTVEDCLFGSPPLTSFTEHYSAPSIRCHIALMRHDVDRKPQNALKMAKHEHELGVNSTYYFRTITKTFKPNIIKEIAELGHEIGYHYENLSTVEILMKNVKCKIENEEEYEEKLFELAIDDFEKNLSKLREIVPIKTICMHGSPLSKLDNRLLWDKYDYRDFGITSEPYFDIDYNKVFYITDTGRQWNNQTSSIRDNVSSNFDIKIKNTKDLISKIKKNQLPNKILINVHPQRWTDEFLPWFSELLMQNIKNVAKYLLNKIRQ